MDVQLRTGWFAGKFAETLGEVLLEVVGKTVLLAEKDDTALGDCATIVNAVSRSGRRVWVYPLLQGLGE
jgi:hypothetical protein